MTEDIRTIQAFLKGYDLDIPMLPEIRKAGLIPYLRGPMRYMVMIPVAKKPELGLPEFQICKGTRMFWNGGEWQDMRGEVPPNAQLETLPETAIREGIEELGIKLGNIHTMKVLGEYNFTSATNAKNAQLWLMAMEMKKEDDFLSKQDIAASTHATRWMSLQEFKKEGRPDHAHILEKIDEVLCA